LVNIRFQIILKFLSCRAGSVVVGASPKPRDFLGMAPVFNDAWLLALSAPTMLRVRGET
jgi:hypothetical protein